MTPTDGILGTIWARESALAASAVYARSQTSTTRDLAEPTVFVVRAHPLMCGDSGSVADLDTLLAGAPVHLLKAPFPRSAPQNERRAVLLAGR
jgi:hypothetical protein